MEGSTNGSEFSKLGTVRASNAREYSFTDNTPLTQNYYRLRLVDKDGKSSLSNVVLIKGDTTQELVLSALYPNPSKDILYMQLQTRNGKQVTVLITDMAGKTVQQQALQLQSGDNNEIIKVSALQKGAYIIKLIYSNGREAAVSKFVKE